MNKLFLVFLAICLVSVHAFVKRDTPAPASDVGGNSLDDLKNFASKAAEDIKKAFNTDTIQKNFDDILKTFNDAFNSKDKKPAN